MSASPLSHDIVMQLFLLFDVSMVSTRTLAAFAVVTAENGGQLLLGQPVGRQGNGAFLSQAPAVLHNNTQGKVRHLNNRINFCIYTHIHIIYIFSSSGATNWFYFAAMTNYLVLFKLKQPTTFIIMNNEHLIIKSDT